MYGEDYLDEIYERTSEEYDPYDYVYDLDRDVDAHIEGSTAFNWEQG